MTRMGVAALLGGIAALVLGLVLGWTAFDLLGIGLLVLVVIGLVNILRPSRLAIDRAIQARTTSTKRSGSSKNV